MTWFCPKCGHELVERPRGGVRVDVCTACRGIWLDQGELEKIVAMARREADEGDRARDERPRDERYRDERGRDDDELRRARHHDDDDDDRRHGGPRRRQSWFERLGDIFD